MTVLLPTERRRLASILAPNGAALARLSVIFGLTASLGACVEARAKHAIEERPIRNAAFVSLYGERPHERFAIPATDVSEIDSRYLRREVDYSGREEPGTIVIDTGARHLYLVREGGRALRYGIGVGRAGLAWSGRARVGRKAEWPRWTPTAAMIAREPERNAKWRGGMAPGLGNPLGARALYLHQGERDTLYRIHGTNEPGTIGTALSSGCIRMFNQDVVDLYDRIPIGAKVVVLPSSRQEPADEPPMLEADGRPSPPPSSPDFAGAPSDAQS